MTNDQLIQLAIILGTMVTLIGIGFALGWYHSTYWWRGEMVERGHARYHFYDGKWYWNEDVPTPSDPIAHRLRAQAIVDQVKTKNEEEKAA